MAGMNWRAKNVGTIAGFLSVPECDSYIQLGEAIGFEEATISTARGAILMKDDRNNDRVMIDDPGRALTLLSKDFQPSGPP
jgi:hypothetical protein